jgi:bifunctional UDP-N-acetylglucosamine pyrophosphorylase / glucosamine-1-phosphate N-acetyltransferase
MNPNLNIVILAAGKGTRMRSSLPKVLHNIGGKPLLEHVLKAAYELNPKKIHVIYGTAGELLKKSLAQYKINWIEQKKQLGTAHAVSQALPFIPRSSQVLILYGDIPLITTKTLKQLISANNDSLGLLTAEFAEPAGLGRIMRDHTNKVVGIVEHKDATASQLLIKEINSGILITTAKILRNYLPRIHQHNAQGEYYLTDMIALLAKDNFAINTLLIPHSEELIGINDQQQLAQAERQYQNNQAAKLMLQGLNLKDPARFDLRGELTIANDITIDINTVIEGVSSIEANTNIGPNNFLKNVTIGKNVVIKANCVIEDAIIEDNCIIGPFARIRPGTHLKKGVHIGNFVEIKNAKIGKGSKANHLSYLGDIIIGNKVNIGAGTITCNYDGVNKYQTVIANNAFIGSNTSLVAPVKIGKESVIGAGSVITKNAPAKKLTIARTRQITIKTWERKNKK